MKILFDMNIPLKYPALLTNKGFDCLRWSDVGLPNATDAEIMKYAFENDFIILTFDLDFSAMLSVTHELKPSIAQIRASIPNAEQIVELISSALLRNADELKKGAILLKGV